MPRSQGTLRMPNTRNKKAQTAEKAGSKRKVNTLKKQTGVKGKKLAKRDEDVEETAYECLLWKVQENKRSGKTNEQCSNASKKVQPKNKADYKAVEVMSEIEELDDPVEESQQAMTTFFENDVEMIMDVSRQSHEEFPLVGDDQILNSNASAMVMEIEQSSRSAKRLDASRRKNDVMNIVTESPVAWATLLGFVDANPEPV